MRILVAEDDPPLAAFLKHGLQHQNFTVQMASTGPEAQRLIGEQDYDLVLLDLNLPASMGLDLLRDIRLRKPDMPLLIASAHSLAEERVRGLDAGADDYLPKPFVFAELTARIRAVLRRGNRFVHALLQVEDLELDRVSHSVSRAGQKIELSPKEFNLLEFLMQSAGQPVSRASIVEQVWKMDIHTTTNIVDVYINYLRRKVDTGHEHLLIRTVRGVGYQIGGNGNRRPAAFPHAAA